MKINDIEFFKIEYKQLTEVIISLDEKYFLNYVVCHVVKVAQSATATWRTICQISWDVGAGTFFKKKFAEI